MSSFPQGGSGSLSVSFRSVGELKMDESDCQMKFPDREKRVVLAGGIWLKSELAFNGSRTRRGERHR